MNKNHPKDLTVEDVSVMYLKDICHGADIYSTGVILNTYSGRPYSITTDVQAKSEVEAAEKFLKLIYTRTVDGAIVDKFFEICHKEQFGEGLNE